MLRKSIVICALLLGSWSCDPGSMAIVTGVPVIVNTAIELIGQIVDLTEEYNKIQEKCNIAVESKSLSDTELLDTIVACTVLTDTYLVLQQDRRMLELEDSELAREITRDDLARYSVDRKLTDETLRDVGYGTPSY